MATDYDDDSWRKAHVVSMGAVYRIEQGFMEDIIASPRWRRTYEGVVAMFCPPRVSDEHWLREADNAFIDAWINNSPEIRSCLGERPFSPLERLVAAYHGGVHYAVQSEYWPRDVFELARAYDSADDDDCA